MLGRKICINKNIELPQNTILSTQGNYTLNNEINFEIIDTYRTKYVIIKSNEKTVYIHLYGNTDLSEVVDTSDGDIFIYNSEIPEEIPPSAKEIIISGESDFIINSDYNKHLDQGENLHLTAKDGDIKIYNLERSICDIIKNENRFDHREYNKLINSIKSYFS